LITSEFFLIIVVLLLVAAYLLWTILFPSAPSVVESPSFSHKNVVVLFEERLLNLIALSDELLNSVRNHTSVITNLQTQLRQVQALQRELDVLVVEFQKAKKHSLAPGKARELRQSLDVIQHTV
jgi:hypothetical protein